MPVCLVSGQSRATTQCHVDLERGCVRRGSRDVADTFGQAIGQGFVRQPVTQDGFGVVGGDDGACVDLFAGFQPDTGGTAGAHDDTVNGRTQPDLSAGRLEAAGQSVGDSAGAAFESAYPHAVDEAEIDEDPRGAVVGNRFISRDGGQQ